MASSVLGEGPEVGKVPGNGRALAKSSGWCNIEKRMQEGAFPGTHTSSAFCWGADGLPFNGTTLTVPAHRHSAPSVLVTVPQDKEE